MAKLDLRKIFRAHARSAQDENAIRLLAGQAVSGGRLAPRDPDSEATTRSRRRLRILGERISLGSISSSVGVRTGAMLRDATRRSNARATRTGFRIVPSAEVRARWFAFNRGRSGEAPQPPRPFSGLSDNRLALVREAVAREAKEQLVRGLKGRGK